MKLPIGLVAAFLAASICGSFYSVPAQAMGAQYEVPVGQPVPSAPGNIEAILHAQDPSAAIQAYAEAVAAEPGSVKAEQVFLRRMVDFGLPEMAGVQALDLLKRDPNNGLAWAVVAYVSAKRDQSPQALAEITSAVKLVPADAFVLRTAGQLVAWYDIRADRTQISADTQIAVEGMRNQLGNNQVYADAYSRAVNGYKSAAQSTPAEAPDSETAQAPGTAPAAETPTAAYPYAAPTIPYYDASLDSSAYPNPYYYQSAAYPDTYAYWWPTPCWSDWWWPTFTNVVIVDRDRRMHHHFDHDGNADDPGFFRHHDLSGPITASNRTGTIEPRTNERIGGITAMPAVHAPAPVFEPPQSTITDSRVRSEPIQPFTPPVVIRAEPPAPRYVPAPAPRYYAPPVSSPGANFGDGVSHSEGFGRRSGFSFGGGFSRGGGFNHSSRFSSGGQISHGGGRGR